MRSTPSTKRSRSSKPKSRALSSAYPYFRYPESPAAPAARRAAPPAAAVDEKLLDALYAVRRDLARREKLPAFMIFPDAVLRDICQRRPRTTADLLAISGIGEVKAARYGLAFLEAVRKGG